MSNSNNEEGRYQSLIRTESLASLAIDKWKDSVNELKEIDTILTKIGIDFNLTSAELKRLKDDAFEYAKKYGVSVDSYLAIFQKMYQTGYKNARQMTELTSLVQSADNISLDLANSYIIAADAAFDYSGNIEKLTRLMDGQNQVANRNALSMEELANATKAAGSMFADLPSLPENEITALLGTGISSSGESGETVARAVKSIIMSLQNISGSGGFDGEIIDEEALARAEKRCRSVGVELRYMKNGAMSLREPMEILKDLANVYNALPKNSTDKSGILSDIGNGSSSNVLAGILSNWNQVEKMLNDYENASCSVMEDAMKSTSSLEGSLNRLGNTWTDTVSNMADSTMLSGAVNILNSLLSGINKITSAIGSFGSIGAVTGLFAGLKNVGSPEMSGLTVNCLKCRLL